MDGKISRRQFLRRTAAATIAGTATACSLPALASANPATEMGMVIDLTKCDGCGKCSLACQKEHNQPENSQPVGLTPDNYLYVQHVVVETENGNTEVYIPRKCMHCDNPACAQLCPFSINEKTPEGPVVIDGNYCLGGQKCKAVCPWHIPQLKKGIGFYKKLEPLPFGAGVMFKCDGCIQRIRAGQVPACIPACPQGAIQYGEKEAMRKLAHQRAQELDGYIYGEQEGGGTSTFYVSQVSFVEIDKALVAQGEQLRMPVEAENVLDTPNGLAQALLFAPIAGVAAAGIAAHKKMKGDGSDAER